MIEFRRFFDRWGWLLTLAILTIVVLCLAWGRDALCGGPGEQCFREWLSALGGWIAVAIGFPTLYILAKQISDANEHHRDIMEQEKRKQRLLANNAKHQVNAALFYVGRLQDSLNEESDFDRIVGVTAAYRQIKQIVNSQELTIFELNNEIPFQSDRLFMQEFADRQLSILEELAQRGFQNKIFTMDETTIRNTQGMIEISNTYLRRLSDFIDGVLSDMKRTSD